MKHIVILFLLLVTTSAQSAEFTDASGAVTATGVREIVWQSISIVDWMQTRTIAKNPDKYYEDTNFFMNKHPSLKEVNTYFIGYMMVHGMVSYVLPEKYDAVWQYVTIYDSGSAVLNNHQLGIKIDIPF